MEMEEKKQCEICPLSSKLLIETIGFFAETLNFLSSLTSDPLFSILVVLYTLVLLYYPRIFLNLIFSPILISTGILLSTLLRLGKNQRTRKEDLISSETQTEIEPETRKKVELETEPFFSESFVEWKWNVRAPLEVIYEEYEGEEENQKVGINGLVSLAIYYPESVTESSSDDDFLAIEGWDSPERMCFRWEEEDNEGLIEIPLELDDGKRSSFYQFEEENLIEIDISPIGVPA